MNSFKILIGALAAPLAIALLLALAGVAFRLFGRKAVAAGLFISAATVAWLGSLAPVGGALMSPLENKYPPLVETAQLSSRVNAIVVLGYYYAPREGLPVTAAVVEEGLIRISEGVRLSMRFPDARLVVSGGAPPGGTPSAVGYARFAREFGVSPERLVLLSTPNDTAEEARQVAALLGKQSFILVTSAYHMPRAMALMRRAGAQPIPAPTGQRTGGSGGSWGAMLVPSALGLRRSELAMHEYMGLTAQALGLD
jgi:uncharacterized SAM-binding protein YcdF (DUF218 family)